MMIYDVSGVICKLGNLCFECVTLYTHFLAFGYSKYSYIACNWNGNRMEWKQ